MTPKQRKDFFDIFGDLTLRFTKNRRYARLDDYESFNKYEVLAADDSSVVLRLFEDQFKKEVRENFEILDISELRSDGCLQQIFFDGNDCIYVESNWNIEFFKRVK